MRTLFSLVTALALVTGQAADTFTSQAAAPVQTSVQTADAKTKITFNNQDPVPFDLVIERPDFDTEILVPLRASQAQAKARAEAEARARRVATAKRVLVAGSDAWYRLRMCESGGNYANKRNPRYRGAYQFAYSTWNNFGGFYDPADAPPSVQDEAARLLQARRGWSPWPACARKLGLI